MNSSILLPFRGEPTRAFAELSKNPIEMQRVARTITEAVNASFFTDAAREGHCNPKITGSEMKRRMAIAIEIFGQLRNDCGYSVARALDVMPDGLRAALDGVAWEPASVDRMWAANG